MFQFFRIILLMFGKNGLHVIAKETRVRIDVSFSSVDGFFSIYFDEKFVVFGIHLCIQKRNTDF